MFREGRRAAHLPDRRSAAKAFFAPISAVHVAVVRFFLRRFRIVLSVGVRPLGMASHFGFRRFASGKEGGADQRRRDRRNKNTIVSSSRKQDAIFRSRFNVGRLHRNVLSLTTRSRRG